MNKLQEQIEKINFNEGVVTKGISYYLMYRGLKDLFKKRQYSTVTNQNQVNNYARELTNAKEDIEAVIAAVGLLNVVSLVFLRVSKLRSLGSQLQTIVKSHTLKNYIEKY